MTYQKKIQKFPFIMCVILCTMIHSSAFCNEQKDCPACVPCDKGDADKGDADIDSSIVVMSDHEVVIQVCGIVSKDCREKLQNALSRLSFVDTSKYIDGVDVNIEEQRITLAIQPEKNPDLREVFSEIESLGYDPAKAYVANEQGEVSVYTKKEILQ